MQKIKYHRVVISFFNSLIASLLFFNGHNYLYVKCVSSISILFFLYLCYLEKENILFFVRTFILGLIGYFPILIKNIFGHDALFSAYEASTQTLRICILMYIFTSYALFSNALGLSLGMSNIRLYYIKDEYIKWSLAYYFSIPLVLVSAYFYTRSFGENLFITSYGSSELSQPSSIGSLNSFGITSLYLVFLAGLKYNFKYWKIILLFLFSYFVIYSQIFHGGRQDAITPIFGMYILYYLVKGKIRPINLNMFPLIVIFLLFFEAWGTLRSNIRDFSFDIFVNLIPAMFNGDAVRFGTVSPIATTFSNLVWLIDSGSLDFFYGKTYFEYILRTPPEFLFPNRPADYSLIFEQNGLQAVGGFFELGEAYLNFGFLGAFLVPGIISYLLSKSYFNVLKKQSLLAYFFLFSFLSSFLRGTWYQTFAFYRTFLVCIFLYFFILVIKSFLFSKV